MPTNGFIREALTGNSWARQNDGPEHKVVRDDEVEDAFNEHQSECAQTDSKEHLLTGSQEDDG